MACSCQNGTKVYVHTLPNGTKQSYDSERDALGAARRDGGTVRAQGK